MFDNDINDILLWDTTAQLLVNESQGRQSNILKKKGHNNWAAGMDSQRGRWKADYMKCG
jgi:hypothetical protein